MKCLVLALTLVASNAHAQKYYPAKFNTELMTFQQLMYMPDAKRIAYIKEVRMALFELEQNVRKSGRPSAETDRLTEKLYALMSQLGIPDAAAEGVDFCPTNYVYREGVGCARQSPQCNVQETAVTSNGESFCVARGRAEDPTRRRPFRVRPVAPPAAIVPPTPAAPVTAPPDLPPARPTPASPPTAPTTSTVPAPATPSRTSPAAVAPGSSAPPAAVQPGTSAPVPLPTTCKLRTDARDYHRDASSFYNAIQPPNPNLRNCIIGGMFSTYRENQIKAGNCKPIQEFPPQSSAAGTDKLKWEGRKAMCNPMLYCTRPDKKPHCLNVTQDFTAACNRLASDTCDPFAGATKVEGAKENWEEFAHDFRNICLGTTAGNRFTEYFCNECKILDERIKKIQAKFAAVGTTPPAPGATPGATEPPAAARATH